MKDRRLDDAGGLFMSTICSRDEGCVGVPGTDYLRVLDNHPSRLCCFSRRYRPAVSDKVMIITRSVSIGETALAKTMFGLRQHLILCGRLGAVAQLFSIKGPRRRWFGKRMSCALFTNQGVRATYMFSPSVVLITLVIRRAFYEGITVKE